ncbi:uncharacterized protein TNCV_3181881 [Trichonephila clavipes]|nr:uncharacterized protein TNCV_3181881 [Trichonephila clavipes]
MVLSDLFPSWKRHHHHHHHELLLVYFLMCLVMLSKDFWIHLIRKFCIKICSRPPHGCKPFFQTLLFRSKRGGTAALAEWYRYRIVACLVTSSNPEPLKTRRVGQRCTLNLSRAETSSRWCGVVVRRDIVIDKMKSGLGLKSFWLEYSKYSHQAAIPLVRLVEGEGSWEVFDNLHGVLPINRGGIEPNRTGPCKVLKATNNDRRKPSPLPRRISWASTWQHQSDGISNNNLLL